ncbi:MAG: hypothetical protein PHX37_03115 [Eubacteriales bacterium]|nr:hypothetical protein [Eubacteriales bacterium]
MPKIFVDVVVKYTKEGSKIPLAVIWENGKNYSVDKVFDITRAASLKAGGQGMRYRCRISGKETCLWLEDDKWFMEA